ncbi:imidazole glycerol phosphate synthase subunit HisH [Peribacillus alkalitolerans]|uniref:imidazole glycerol phosphate synthase subunit HisH n=1 Tax=Peribacillus alkalitolerans TaxID=1550385 RepID=UPI0013D8A892|nr:imidazole glycerol phosphate synthase subunit HisH [Peribacillus alkalitolerans]
MIGIVDYGMGNLFSVNKALERLGVDSFISDEPEKLLEASALIVPGVGSFKDAMFLLNEKRLDEMIKKFATSQKPLLGICLGMQLLFEESEENGLTTGLQLLPGKVVRFSGNTSEGMAYKVPHMGWNNLVFHQESPLLKGMNDDHVYFVHSYYAALPDKDVLIASADYHVQVPAIVGRGNVLGMQFHPEKSGEAGMQLLRNFLHFKKV